MKMILLKPAKKPTGEGILINSEFLNGLKAPNESIVKLLRLLKIKNLGQKK